jgi:hypothetical protein
MGLPADVVQVIIDFAQPVGMNVAIYDYGGPNAPVHIIANVWRSGCGHIEVKRKSEGVMGEPFVVRSAEALEAMLVGALPECLADIDILIVVYRGQPEPPSYMLYESVAQSFQGRLYKTERYFSEERELDMELECNHILARAAQYAWRLLN